MQRQNQISALLNDNFSIAHIELVNESHMHSVPPNSETHFKLTMVSDDFAAMNKVKRHQAIYKIMAPLMEEGLHALALHLYTVEEWQTQQGQVPASPNCMGGSKAG